MSETRRSQITGVEVVGMSEARQGATATMRGSLGCKFDTNLFLPRLHLEVLSGVHGLLGFGFGVLVT